MCVNIYLHIYTHTTGYEVDEETEVQSGVTPDLTIGELPTGAAITGQP